MRTGSLSYQCGRCEVLYTATLIPRRITALGGAHASLPSGFGRKVRHNWGRTLQSLVFKTSRIKFRLAPGALRFFPAEDDAIVQAEGTVVPEFDTQGHDAKARPVGRTGNIPQAELGGLHGNGSFEFQWHREGARLLGSPGPDA